MTWASRASRVGRAAFTALVLLLAAAGCSADGASDEAGPEPDPSPSIRTLTPLPAPPEAPPSGRLLAEVRQSSRDAALGRFQVWIDNDTEATMTPTRITYHDSRLRTPVVAERLRPAPAQAERGFTLALPDRPVCDGDPAASTPGEPREPREPGEPGRIEVRHDGRTEQVLVEDPADVVGRFVRARCLELAVAEVARLRWSDRVVAPGDVSVEVGDTATLTLVVEPSGRAGEGRELVVETVGATTILSPVDGSSAWRPGLRVRADGQRREVALPVRPTRCDVHAFLESGGATALRLHVRLVGPDDSPGGGQEGDLGLRMGPAGAAAAIDFAARSCGLGDT